MNKPLTDTTALAARIEGKLDTSRVEQTEISQLAGGLSFRNVTEVLEFSKLMSLSGIAVRKPFRNDPGACLGVVVQAIEWGMSPYAVANRAYVVNDQLAFESQLVQAVILRRAPIKGRIKFRYEGEGDERVCIASAVDLFGDTLEYRSPPIGRISPKNSPLWKNDPDQQLSYYAGRSLCRRHFPDVLQGIYDRDEIEGSEGLKDVTPPQGTGLAARLGQSGGFDAEHVDDATREAAGSGSHSDESKPHSAKKALPTASGETDNITRVDDVDVIRDAQRSAGAGDEREPPDGVSEDQRELWLRTFDQTTAEANA